MNVHMVKPALNSRPISMLLDSMSPVFRPSPTLQAHSCLRPLQYSFAHHPQVRQRKHDQVHLIEEFPLPGALGDQLKSSGGKAHLFHGSTVSNQAVTGVTFADLP